jgi:hypothetical protein
MFGLPPSILNVFSYRNVRDQVLYPYKPSCLPFLKLLKKGNGRSLERWKLLFRTTNHLRLLLLIYAYYDEFRSIPLDIKMLLTCSRIVFTHFILRAILHFIRVFCIHVLRLIIFYAFWEGHVCFSNQTPTHIFCSRYHYTVKTSVEVYSAQASSIIAIAHVLEN